MPNKILVQNSKILTKNSKIILFIKIDLKNLINVLNKRR